MQFHSGYASVQDLYGGMDSASPMDRDFYDGNSPAEDLGIGINDVGMSVPLGISAANVQGVYSKIRSGVGKMELGFPGAISGNRQAQTPEMYGKDQRQALRELAAINEVEYTTHAAYQMMGMTGAIEQASDMIKFDMNRARMVQHEVERVIDFAADVAGGGSVVIHTGEFLRPLTDMYLDPTKKHNLSAGEDGRIMFKQRLTEDKDAKFYLVDDRTGQAMSTVEKDRLVAYPVWNKYLPDNTKFWERERGKSYIDDNGSEVRQGDYIDYRGNRVNDPFDPRKGRVPLYDNVSGRFRVRYMSYDDFDTEAKEKNYYKQKRIGRPLTFYETITQTEAFLQATLETNEGHSRGWALQYADRVDKEFDLMDKLYKAKEVYSKLDASIPESEKWKIMVQESAASHSHALQQLIPPDSKNPVELIDENISSLRKQIEFARQASVSQEQQAEDTAEQKRHIVEPLKYVEKFTIRHYAEAGLHAMNKTIDPQNPIFVSIEHIFPERFGGHPQELKWIVKKAREKMEDYLTSPEMELGTTYAGQSVFDRDPVTQELILKKQKNPYFVPGMSKGEAKKIAEDHIKATLDTGHLNMWRKYFQPKPGATSEQNEAEFKKWYLGQIEGLAKEGLVGNVHLVDNYGYQDDHLSPGTGNAPLKEALAVLKKFGYDKAITIEPGADASTDLSDFHGLMKTWRYLGSPIYGFGASSGGQQRWSQVQYGYFGQGQPPYFIFGAYAPSNDWTLWSQTPME